MTKAELLRKNPDDVVIGEFLGGRDGHRGGRVVVGRTGRMRLGWRGVCSMSSGLSEGYARSARYSRAAFARIALLPNHWRRSLG